MQEVSPFDSVREMTISKIRNSPFGLGARWPFIFEMFISVQMVSGKCFGLADILFSHRLSQK
jgi:hypothetical protein